jgi:flagellar basal body-associated protein FliL
MSEEQTQDTNDGTWSGLKKTIIGTLTTVIAGGGVWVSTMLFGGSDEEPKEETKTEQSVVRERIIERPAQQPQPQPEKPKKVEEESW